MHIFWVWVTPTTFLKDSPALPIWCLREIFLILIQPCHRRRRRRHRCCCCCCCCRRRRRRCHCRCCCCCCRRRRCRRHRCRCCCCCRRRHRYCRCCYCRCCCRCNLIWQVIQFAHYFTFHFTITIRVIRFFNSACRLICFSLLISVLSIKAVVVLILLLHCVFVNQINRSLDQCS